MHCKVCVGEEEGQGGEECSSEQERPHSKDTGKYIHTKHHLNGGHFVCVEKFRLPVGGEAIKHHVAK